MATAQETPINGKDACNKLPTLNIYEPSSLMDSSATKHTGARRGMGKALYHGSF